MPSPLSPSENTGWKLRYFSIFTGQALSLVGSAVTQFVLMWWITTTTGSATALSTAGICAMLPQALLGPLGGTFADRYSRRLIMVIADLISAACMGILILLFAQDAIQMWHVYLMMAIRSSMQAFQGPAAQASTMTLVPTSFLPRAAGLNQSMLGIMTIASAPIGALALGVMPLHAALMIDVTTALFGILPLLIFKIPRITSHKDVPSNLWSEFKEGVSLVWDRRPLRALFALNGGVILVLMPCFALIPLLVKNHFEGDASSIALMEGLAGIGMALGGIAFMLINPKRRVITFALGMSLSCAFIGMTALATKDTFPIAVLCWTISGLAFSFGNAPMSVLIQSSVSNQIQGRVFSLLNIMMGLAAPCGLVLIGPISEAFGVRLAFIGSGFLAAIICLLGAFSKDLLALENAEPIPLEILPENKTD